MTYEDAPPLRLPTLDSLPGEDASLREYGQFVDTFDPTKHFRLRWGESYDANASALHKLCVERYNAGQQPSAIPLDELMMYLTYQWAHAPYLSLPESYMIPLLRWVVGGIRTQLSAGTDSTPRR